MKGLLKCFMPIVAYCGFFFSVPALVITASSLQFAPMDETRTSAMTILFIASLLCLLNTICHVSYAVSDKFFFSEQKEEYYRRR
jgi:hypothetical protein